MPAGRRTTPLRGNRYVIHVRRGNGRLETRVIFVHFVFVDFIRELFLFLVRRGEFEIISGIRAFRTFQGVGTSLIARGFDGAFVVGRRNVVSTRYPGYFRPPDFFRVEQ